MVDELVVDKKIVKFDREEDDVLCMLSCIDDARRIVLDKRLLESQSSIVSIAVALFEKRFNGGSK